ncbi:MAG TPA: nucleotidyltransferase family protein [Rhodanobacteraceae bacterium]|nr:nucleotidyltransferase family protein [Rhodanobacteraceae bacterium]
MRALIFAAGLGERMRPLTDRTPKPLLEARGKPLVVHHLERLADSGVRYVVINTSHLAEQFPAMLGDGSRWGLRIRYAYEGGTPLETGGGMLHALPMLTDEPFLAVNGDIFTDFDFATLPAEPDGLAHLVLVDNPSHHPDGDFRLLADGRVATSSPSDDSLLTFAGIGVYRPALLDNWRAIIGDQAGANDKPPRFKLAPLLRHAMRQGGVTGQRHQGVWCDVGSPERLAQLDDLERP